MARSADAQANARWGNHVASPPRLLLDLKGSAYSVPVVQRITTLAKSAGVADRLAVWAVDEVHAAIVREGSQGGLALIWGCMDQPWSDEISSVPFPAPFPPPVLVRGPAMRAQRSHSRLTSHPRMQDNITLWGISAQAPRELLQQARQLPQAGVVSWLVDTPTAMLEARDRGAAYVISNKPFAMAAFLQGVSLSELRVGGKLCVN